MTDADILNMDIDELADYVNTGRRKQIPGQMVVATNVGRSLNEPSGV